MTKPTWCVDESHDTPCQPWCGGCIHEQHTDFVSTDEARELYSLPPEWPENIWLADDLKDPRP